MENNIFIKNNVEKIKRGDHTSFLQPNELQQVISILNKSHIKYNIYKPFLYATKVVVYKDKEPTISLIEIICNQELKHSDILGTLFSHNINPEKYGDIIVDDKYYIIVLEPLEKYLISNLDTIKKNKVRLEQRDMEIIENYKYKYDELNILVSSLRIDNVVSSITNCSRSQTDIMFKNKNILVNYNIVLKKTSNLHENDIVSIRHFGKYKYMNIIKKTKGCKYIINMLKYK